MRKKDQAQAQQIVNHLHQSMKSLLDVMTRSLSRLETLLNRCQQDEDRFVSMQQMQQLDGECGDYMHRPNGKKPLAGRFRFIDEAAPFTQNDYEFLHQRTHREKSDTRRGRQSYE